MTPIASLTLSTSLLPLCVCLQAAAPESSHSPPIGRSKAKSHKSKRKTVEMATEDALETHDAPSEVVESSMPQEKGSSKPSSLSGKRSGSEIKRESSASKTTELDSSKSKKAAKKEDEDQNVTTKPLEEQLLDILDDARDTSFFRKYMVSEYLDEVLDFYLAVDDWRTLYERYQGEKRGSKKHRKVTTAAVDLYMNYVQNDAPRMLNIPGNERLCVAEVFANLQMAIDTAAGGASSPASSPPSASAAGSLLDFSSPPPRAPVAFKLPKNCPELDQLPLHADSFDELQGMAFNMMLEPFSRFMERESHSFRQLQIDRFRRPIPTKSSPAPIPRRLALKAYRPVRFEDLSDDPDIMAAFQSVLKKEHCDDYLRFYRRLESFADTKVSSELASLASRIFEDFILQEKVYIPVQESPDLSNRIRNGKFDRHLFDSIRWEVESILRTKFSENLSTIASDVTKSRRHRHT